MVFKEVRWFEKLHYLPEMIFLIALLYSLRLSFFSQIFMAFDINLWMRLEWDFGQRTDQGMIWPLARCLSAHTHKCTNILKNFQNKKSIISKISLVSPFWGIHHRSLSYYLQLLAERGLVNTAGVLWLGLFEPWWNKKESGACSQDLGHNQKSGKQ